jgi:hypothetical protein
MCSLLPPQSQRVVLSDDTVGEPLPPSPLLPPDGD